MSTAGVVLEVWRAVGILPLIYYSFLSSKSLKNHVISLILFQ